MKKHRLLVASSVAVAGVMSLGALALAAWIAWPLPSGLLDPSRDAGVRIFDRHGVLLRATRGEQGTRERWTPLDAMDTDLLVAFVAVEDRRFWEHGGVDLRAVGRAARDNLRAGRIVSGASTISMQLARLLNPTTRGLRAKIHETAWALRLEWHLPKQVILEQYLNRVNLGQSAVGVGAASAIYMGASPDELSVGEAALLAGLAQAPSRDNPVTSPRRALARRDVALARMERVGAISEAAAARARAEPALTRLAVDPFLAPHFTTRLLLSAPTSPRADVVHTTLDAGLQAEIESEVRQAVLVLKGRGVRQAAVVVLDNQSGGVLAWVGSPDFWERRSGQTDMVVSPRQPGSALKPFLYALAFDRGVTAATVLPDVPRAFATATGVYEPRNYDRRFRGPVRVREALGSSYNVPAVELAERMGTGAFLHTLHLAGFSSLRRTSDYYGLGLALGNGDVTLVELANGYRALAMGGTYRSWRWRSDGEARAPGDGRRIVSPEAAALVLDILSDRVARMPGFGTLTPFDFPFPVAVKTGTSRHFTDNWAIATTGNFTVAVWAGDVTGKPMEGVSGVSGAGPLLHRAVMLTSERYSPGVLSTPAELGLEPVDICRVSGMLATRECPGMREWFLVGTAPAAPDEWVRDGRIHLPVEYAAWVAQGSGGYALADAVRAGLEDLDQEHSDGEWQARPSHLDGPKGFHIVSPAEGDVYRMPPGVPDAYASIALLTAGESGAVRWYVNGEPYARSRWTLRAGDHHIRAVAQSGVSVEVRIRVAPR